MREWKIVSIVIGVILVVVGTFITTSLNSRNVENLGIKRYTGVYRVAQVEGDAYIIQAEMTNGNHDRWWEYQGREKSLVAAEAMMRISVQWFLEYRQKETDRRALVTNVVLEVDVSSVAR